MYCLSLLVCLDKRFKCQPDFCNAFYDIFVISKNLGDIAVLNIHGVAYRCIINGIRKRDALGLFDNVNPNDKRGI